MRRLFILLVLLAFACNAQDIHPELKRAVSNFERYYDVKVSADVYMVKDIRTGAAGVYNKAKHQVYISKRVWDQHFIYGKYWIVYHELLHSFGIGHTEHPGMMQTAIGVEPPLDMQKMFLEYRKEYLGINQRDTL